MKKSLIKIIKLFGIGITFVYPFVVFFALKKHVAVRVLALLLLTVAGIAFIRNKNIWIFVFVLLLGLGLVVFNDVFFLKLYPVLMNTAVCLMFALSLRDVPLIERFATNMGYNINKKSKKYSRQVTWGWSIFMACMSIISLITVFLSDETWVWFNGLISYILIAIMMCIEFIVRRRVVNARKNK